MNSIENKFNNETTVSDIRKELFEDDNVVIDKNNDHGLSELTINKPAEAAADASAEIATKTNVDGKPVVDETIELSK